MKNKLILKPYKKEFDYSYTSGAYATYELIKIKPEIVKAVYIHSRYSNKEEMERVCRDNKITFLYDDKTFIRISQKENSYIIGVFEKHSYILDKSKPHVVLVNPSDMGNIGTIIRTMAGFNIHNLAIITPAADIFNPKTIRASMGALFRINFQLFNSFEEYRQIYSRHWCYPFMLKGEICLNIDNCSEGNLFSLIFGNEATGLDEGFVDIGTSVKIPSSDLVDSLNLSIAAGIGIFTFASKNGLI